MKDFNTCLLAMLALTIASCSGPARPVEPKRSIQTVFEEYYQKQLEFNPIEATQAGKEGYNDRLPDFLSDQYVSQQIEFFQGIQQELNQFNHENLTESQGISRDVLLWELDVRLDGLRNSIILIKSPLFGLPMMKPLPLNQIFSLHLFMGQLGSGSGAQPFESIQDYEDWLSRMDDYFVFINSAIQNMSMGINRGVVLPEVITVKMIDQLDPFIDTPTLDHLYYGPIRNFPPQFSKDDKQRLSLLYEQMIEDQLVPVYQELQDFLSETYLPACRETSGIGFLPAGIETYNILIRQHTSTTMTAEEIHQLGLKEVARIQKEMEQVKQMTGFEGDLKAFFNHIRTSKEQMPFTDPVQVIQNFESIHERMQPYVSALFDLMPNAGFEVRRTESFREASASAEYSTGSIDGSRPGIFYVPIPDVSAYNKYTDESLFLHEAIPGHHFQLSLQQENHEIPEFMKAEGLGVFAEGWALYCESLGKELGLYDDPYQYFGMLSAEMHRAIRLVVDTGIHAMGWTRDQAIQYSLDHEAESEASIIAEIERYMVAPGQALSYKIGQLKILELRSRAEQALGAQFDIKEFHNQVLESGSLPLDVLEKKIDRWIEGQGA